MRPIWIALTLLATAAGGDATERRSSRPVRPESRIWIAGASNIRRFTCRARAVSGSMSLRAVPTRGSALSGENVSHEPSLAIRIDQVDCGIGAMNRHLREALHGEAHPMIEFRLSDYTVDLSAPAPVARIAGHITIAGVRRPIALTARVIADSLGTLRVRGTLDVRMSDFAVQPPRRFGGLLRVRDSVTVHFDVAPDPCDTADEVLRSSATYADSIPR